MSEQQSESDRPANTKQEGQDDREPTPERQAELRAAYEANVAAGKAPYDHVEIRTRGELHWVVQERKWSSDFELPEGYERANLSGADLLVANLSGEVLYRATLSGASLLNVNLSGAVLGNTTLSGAHLRGATLSGAYLRLATLSGADLRYATLSEADLTSANLNGADLAVANLRGANLYSADLSEANLTSASMDATTVLQDASLDTHTLLADVVWNGVPLTRLNWQDVALLGDEQVARQSKYKDGIRKNKALRLREYADAVLANRQVATVLRSQGLNEHADRFAYRAQLCQRRLLRMQRHYLRYLGSLFLGLISGYGYRPLRSLFTYVLVVLGFAVAYFFVAANVGVSMPPLAALVFSVTSFHGRGFMPGENVPLTNPLTVLAAAEAIIGLLIEITFIATFTQRFFAR